MKHLLVLMSGFVCVIPRPIPLPKTGLISSSFHAQIGDKGQCQGSGPALSDPCKFCKCVGSGKCYLISPGCAWDRNREQLEERGCSPVYKPGSCCPQVVCEGSTYQPGGHVITTAAPPVTTTRTTTTQPTTTAQRTTQPNAGFTPAATQPTLTTPYDRESTPLDTEITVDDKQTLELEAGKADEEESVANVEQTSFAGENSILASQPVIDETEEKPFESFETEQAITEIDEATTESLIPTQIPTTPVSFESYKPTAVTNIVSEVATPETQETPYEQEQIDDYEEQGYFNQETVPAQNEATVTESYTEAEDEYGDYDAAETPLDEDGYGETNTAFPQINKDSYDYGEAPTQFTQTENTVEVADATDTGSYFSPAQTDKRAENQDQLENLSSDYDSSTSDNYNNNADYEAESSDYDYYDSASSYDANSDNFRDEKPEQYYTDYYEETPAEAVATEYPDISEQATTWEVDNEEYEATSDAGSGITTEGSTDGENI